MPRWRLFLFLAIVLRAQIDGQQYRYDTYDQSDGLTNLQIHSIAFDRDGFLWLATLNGAFRFLGSKFEHYGPEQGLSERQVEKIFVDHEGRVWAATDTNLYFWHSSRFQLIKTEAGGVGLVDDLLSSGKNRLFLLKGRQLIDAAFDESINRVVLKPMFSAAQRTSRPELNQIAGLAQLRDGTLWMGCGNKICSYQHNNLKLWGHDQGVAAGSWSYFQVDQRDNVWVRGDGNRILQLRLNSPVFQERTPPGVSSSRFFRWRSLLEDRLGRILVNSEKGILRWDNSSWRAIGNANGLDTSTVTSLAKDSNGDIWMGTLRGLWHWVGYENWESWTEAQGLPSSGIWSLNPAPNGSILIGTIKGPARWNTQKEHLESIRIKNSWPWAQVSGISEDKSAVVWMTTFAGSVLRSQSHFASIRPFAELALFTGRLCIAKDGIAWIAAENGIYSVDTAGSFTSLKRDEEAARLLGKQSPQISLARGVDNTDDYVWVAIPHGLIVRNRNKWEKPQLLGLDLKRITIKEISEAPDGTLLICGLDQSSVIAVWRLRWVGDGQLLSSRITLPSEFNGLLPLAILGDHRGWLWLGTDNGLLGWNGSQWRVFDRQNGLTFNDINRSVLRESANGDIWIGTPAGAGHIIRVETVFDKVSLPLKITLIQANGMVAKTRDVGDLNWVHNHVSFEFSSPSTWNRSTLSFHYRLLGMDSVWTETRESDATFSNLSPGTYRFQVFAQNSGNGSRSKVDESVFRILPPWWRTLWFYAGCTVVSIVLVWLLLRLRTKQLQAKKRDLERTVQEMQAETLRLAERAQDASMAEERNRLAHELHDSLAASFTAIFMQLQAATDLAPNDDERSRACVARAEELSRKGLQHVRQFTQSLIARSDQPMPTISSLQEIVTSATAGTPVSGSFEVQGEERPLNPECALALGRILQEAVGNAQRYSRSDAISVRLRFGERSVFLFIEDDGIGFRAEMLHDNGFGLAGMRARAVRLGGSFEVRSSPGNGVKIAVAIPHPYPKESTL